ncbi:MAG: carbohydrate ABC transporter permease [Chloroflexi bacterium]|nr:MAG: carbohydrate ABC transporter permease [Chloroflexota bacterium]
MKISPRKVLGKVFFYLFLVVLAIPFVVPFWWMITASFKKPIDLFNFPPPIIPPYWEVSNFTEAFTFQPFGRHYLNSIYISLIVTIGVLFITSLSGYAFARIKFKGSNFLFIMLLSALMMPSEVTIVPNFMFMKSLDLTDSHMPLLLLPVFGAGGVVSMFMMRQFFLTLPVELEDAARMDGLGRFGIYWKVALPIAKPALAAVAILTFLASWNAFLEPFIFLNDLNLFTLPLSLRNFRDAYGTPIWTVQLAATTMSILPVLIFYIFAQKQVIESFSFSGVKG